MECVMSWKFGKSPSLFFLPILVPGTVFYIPTPGTG